MNLVQALRLSSNTNLALVGAGGKTTAIFQLARQLPPPVIVTATTHLGIKQLDHGDQLIIVETEDALDRLAREPLTGVVLVIGPVGEDGRASGLDSAKLERLFSLAQSREISLLIEADGSRQRPLKAPAKHEPALPSFIDTVIVMAGLSALGKPLSPDWVHRPDLFSALSGLHPHDPITPEAIARVLTSSMGGLKNVPQGVRRVALLNQADTPVLQAQAQRISAQLLPAYHSVVIASLQHPNQGSGQVSDADLAQITVHEPVAGVILAAGGSSRMGQPKQLLTWRDKPFVYHIAAAALTAGLSPVVVVTGAYGDQVGGAVKGLPVIRVHNPDWESGQSSSLQAGLKAISPEVGAVIFMLADQPQVQAPLLLALVATHSSSLAPIIAPLVDGQRANPVLFDRLTFSDLKAIRGDVGGRAVFSRYPVTWLEWYDKDLLLDVDTVADYEKLLGIEKFEVDK